MSSNPATIQISGSFSALPGLFLVLVEERGDIVSRTALIVAFLGGSAALGADQIRKNREAKKETPVS